MNFLISECFRPTTNSLKVGEDPFMGKKKVFPFIGFMVFKTTGLSSRFQRSNRFWKICIGSWVIGQNVQNLVGLVWRVQFGHVLINISGSDAYFSKPIAALKPWAQAGCFEYHEPYKRKNFFLTYKGVLPNFQRICGGSTGCPIKSVT